MNSSSSAAVGNVRSAHKLDEDVLRTYLTSALPQIQWEGVTIKQFVHGQSNPTYLLTLQNGRKFVLRKQPPGKLLRGAHAVDREYLAMTALFGHLPVPRTRLMCNTPDIIGTPFFVYDYVDGRLLRDARLPTVPVTGRADIFTAMAQTLAQLHAIDPNHVGLGNFGASTGYLERQIKVWTKQFEASVSEGLDRTAMDKLSAWLPQHLPAEMKSCLVHGDYRLDNLLFDPQQPKIVAVMDWELSTIGHPMSDLAYNCIHYHMPPSDSSVVVGLAGEDLKALGLPTEEQYLRTYMNALRHEFKHAADRKSPATAKSVEEFMAVDSHGLPADWKYYLSFAFFRISAILQGVYKRSLLGNASAENARSVGALASMMAEVSWKLAQEHRPTGHRSANNHKSGEGKPAEAKAVAWPVPIFPPPSPNALSLYKQVKEFVNEEILPVEASVLRYQYTHPNKWTSHAPELAQLQAKAKSAGLWNLFLNRHADPGTKFGAGLTNLEYAPMAEEMGRSMIAPGVFNCNAPDTGNMEVLAMYGSPEQQAQWLQPLLDGKIRSCFAMTEPGVASSDATNMQATIEPDGPDHVRVNGHKWYISGATDPDCKVAIFMGRDLSMVQAGMPPHSQHSMVLVPMDSPGITVVRPMHVMGFDDAPHGHAEILFHSVRVPRSAIISGPGRGFEIAQGRLGPGRIHHCMRLLGMSERSIELMCARAASRTAFGKHLSEMGSVQHKIAVCRQQVEQARLLTLKCAHMMDTVGNKEARLEVSMIKSVAPLVAQHVVDEAMQIHGAMGVSQDSPLAHFWASARSLRLADGPDEVHLTQIAKLELKAQQKHQAAVKLAKSM